MTSNTAEIQSNPRVWVIDLGRSRTGNSRDLDYFLRTAPLLSSRMCLLDLGQGFCALAIQLTYAYHYLHITCNSLLWLSVQIPHTVSSKAQL